MVNDREIIRHVSEYEASIPYTYRIFSWFGALYAVAESFWNG